MGIFTEYMKGELWCFSGTWFVYLMPKSKKDFFIIIMNRFLFTILSLWLYIYTKLVQVSIKVSYLVLHLIIYESHLFLFLGVRRMKQVGRVLSK